MVFGRRTKDKVVVGPVVYPPPPSYEKGLRKHKMNKRKIIVKSLIEIF